MKNKETKKTLPIIYQKVKTNLIHYSNFVLGSSPIKALHYHDKLEIGVCLSGNGITYIKDRIYSFKEGDIQCVPSGIEHLSTSQDGEKSRWKWLTFSPLEVLKNAGITNPESIVSLTDQNNFPCGLFDKNQYPFLSKTINYLIECVEQMPHDNQAIAFALGSFLVECIKIAKQNPQENVESKITGVNGLLDYISENLDDNFALSEQNLAKKLGVSIASLNRVFLSQTGYPPKTFIMRYRMATAEWLLSSSNLSIIEISVKVGYSDTSGFNRIFKRFFNTTPYQYRKANKNN